MDTLSPSDDPREAVDQLSRWLASGSQQPLLISTSGSMGQPKRVVLSRSAVLSSAAASLAYLAGLGLATGPWALLLPSSYVAGVQVIVRSLLSGHDPVLGDMAGASYTSLVPTQLHRLMRDPDAVEQLAGLQAVLLGGGPIDPAQRAFAEDAGVRVIATYGASETAGGCVYDGVPLDGVDVHLDQKGRISLGGPTIFERYEGDPELTARCLVDGRYRTDDAGEFGADGQLRVLGRLDDVAISGGVNVPLPAVGRRLREHPDLDEVEVIAVPDAEWGAIVTACVVGRSVPPLEVLRDFVSEVHPRAWAPRRLVRLPALPLLANGKVDRQALLGAAMSPGVAGVAGVEGDEG